MDFYLNKSFILSPKFRSEFSRFFVVLFWYKSPLITLLNMRLTANIDNKVIQQLLFTNYHVEICVHV